MIRLIRLYKRVRLKERAATLRREAALCETIAEAIRDGRLQENTSAEWLDRVAGLMKGSAERWETEVPK